MACRKKRKKKVRPYQMLVRPTEKVGSTSSTIGKISLEPRNQSFFGLVLKFVECVHSITSYSGSFLVFHSAFSALMPPNDLVCVSLVFHVSRSLKLISQQHIFITEQRARRITFNQTPHEIY